MWVKGDKIFSLQTKKNIKKPLEFLTFLIFNNTILFRLLKHKDKFYA